MLCIGYIYVPMLTPYIVFLLKNATWFSSKVFPKYCIGNILFLTHNPFVCDLAYFDIKKYTENARLQRVTTQKHFSLTCSKSLVFIMQMYIIGMHLLLWNIVSPIYVGGKTNILFYSGSILTWENWLSW